MLKTETRKIPAVQATALELLEKFETDFYLAGLDECECNVYAESCGSLKLSVVQALWRLLGESLMVQDHRICTGCALTRNSHVNATCFRAACQDWPRTFLPQEKKAEGRQS